MNLLQVGYIEPQTHFWMIPSFLQGSEFNVLSSYMLFFLYFYSCCFFPYI